MKIPYFALFLMLILACSTDDIAPTLIQFNASSTNLNENNGTVILSAKLNANASETIIIPFTISGSAVLDSDYSISSNQITINAGSDTGEIILTGIDDNIIEVIETIQITIENTSSVISFQNFQLNIQLLDNDTDTDNDGVPDSDDACPTEAGEIDNNGCPYLGFLINEIHYDPEGTLAGDANGDGLRDANEDEFIEFFNSGPALDISGYRIFDSSALQSNSPRHVFPAGTIIPANGVIVVFGGGNPTGNFGGAIVQTASGGQINMSNAGDVITIQDASGNELLMVDIGTSNFSGNPDESYTRNPDLTGEFVQHASIPEANNALFSPGTKLDGSSF